MTAFRIFIWMLPEILGVILVIGGPIFYRKVVGGILNRAIDQFNDKRIYPLSFNKRQANALADYYLDFNLGVVSVILLGFTIVKLSAHYWDNSDLRYILMVVAFGYLILAFFWLAYIYIRNNVIEYMLPTGDKINIFKVRRWKWGRVSGCSGIRIWWTRLIPACIALYIAYNLAPKA